MCSTDGGNRRVLSAVDKRDWRIFPCVIGLFASSNSSTADPPFTVGLESKCRGRRVSCPEVPGTNSGAREFPVCT